MKWILAYQTAAADVALTGLTGTAGLRLSPPVVLAKPSSSGGVAETCVYRADIDAESRTRSPEQTAGEVDRLTGYDTVGLYHRHRAMTEKRPGHVLFI